MVSGVCQKPDWANGSLVNLDDHGKQTDDGRFSFRPNPAWFRDRVDPVDMLAMTTRTLSESAAGEFAFPTPDSRAVLTHFKRIIR